MHYLNEYYKSHTYESVTHKEKHLHFLKHPLRAPHLCADFLERIVRTIRGFTVPHRTWYCHLTMILTSNSKDQAL